VVESHRLGAVATENWYEHLSSQAQEVPCVGIT
jgi:hypothetical protein